MGLGFASGLGAGIGAVASYKVADALVAKTPPPPRRPDVPLDRPQRRRPPACHVVRDLPHRPLAAARRRGRGAAGRRALRHAPAGGPAVPGQVLPQRPAGTPLLRLRLVVVGPRLREGEHRARDPGRGAVHGAGRLPRREGPDRGSDRDRARPGRRTRRPGPSPRSEPCPQVASGRRDDRCDRGSNCS